MDKPNKNSNMNKIKFTTQKKEISLFSDEIKSVPGPGEYNIRGSFDINPHKKKATFVKESRFKNIKEGPGPGQYINETDTKNKHNSFSIPQNKREFSTNGKLNLDENLDQPGPGAYNPKSSKKVSKVTIGLPNKPMKKLSTPGPGAFELTKQNDKTTPSYKIGTSTRTELIINKEVKDNPGPGMYSTANQKTSNLIFGKSPKYEKNKNTNPGPGNYYIPCSIVDVPDYLTVGGNFDKTFKYV